MILFPREPSVRVIREQFTVGFVVDSTRRKNDSGDVGFGRKGQSPGRYDPRRVQRMRHGSHEMAGEPRLPAGAPHHAQSRRAPHQEAGLPGEARPRVLPRGPDDAEGTGGPQQRRRHNLPRETEGGPQRPGNTESSGRGRVPWLRSSLP